MCKTLQFLEDFFFINQLHVHVNFKKNYNLFII